MSTDRPLTGPHDKTSMPPISYAKPNTKNLSLPTGTNVSETQSKTPKSERTEPQLRGEGSAETGSARGD